MKRFIISNIFICIVLLFNNCAMAPQSEIDAAKTALEAAKTAQADVYLEADYLEIQDSLNTVMVELESQSSKLFKDYGQSKEKLAVITTQAIELVAKTNIRKEEIRTEIAIAQAEILAWLDQNKALIARAPKGKNARDPNETIKSYLTDIEYSIDEVQGLVANGDLHGAQTKVNSAQQKATELQSDFSLDYYYAPTMQDDDFDGVPNNLDRCPTLPGKKENYGCPTNALRDSITQDTTLRRAILGFSYYKIIPSKETRDLRANVVINGTSAIVKSNIRKIETKKLAFVEKVDTTARIIGIIENIEVYRKLKISFVYDKEDFTITPIETEEEQVLDFINGNNWHWKIRAVSEVPHLADITMLIDAVTPDSVKYHIDDQPVPIEIVIGPPETKWSKIFDYILKYIDLILVTIITITVGYFINKALNRKKGKR